MSDILVTGASGFVGKALCDLMVQRGLGFLAAVRNNPNNIHRTVTIGNINAATDWTSALKEVHAVVHLAARVHVLRDREQSPARLYNAMNVDATLNLARQAAASGVRRFIFISSLKACGEETTHRPFTAFDLPAPQDPYGQSKRAAEIALLELADHSDLEVVIIRPPIVYGPGVGANFRRLMQLIAFGVPLPFGQVKNQRSMVAIDNLVDLILLCVEHPKAIGQTFMVSDDCDVGTPELIHIIAAEMGRHQRMIRVHPKLILGLARLLGRDDLAGRLVNSLQVDIEHTKSTLDWKPKTTPDIGIRETVTHFISSNNVNR